MQYYFPKYKRRPCFVIIPIEVWLPSSLWFCSFPGSLTIVKEAFRRGFLFCFVYLHKSQDCLNKFAKNGRALCCLYCILSPNMGSTQYTGHAFVCCSQYVVQHYAPSDGHLDKSEEITDQWLDHSDRHLFVLKRWYWSTVLDGNMILWTVILVS